MTPVCPSDREQALLYASCLTASPANSAAVVAAAQPLLAFLEASPSRDDQRHRLAALARQWVNTKSVMSWAQDADAHEFVRHATGLYAFAVEDTLPRCPDYLDAEEPS